MPRIVHGDDVPRAWAREYSDRRPHRRRPARPLSSTGGDDAPADQAAHLASHGCDANAGRGGEGHARSRSRPVPPFLSASAEVAEALEQTPEAALEAGAVGADVVA